MTPQTIITIARYLLQDTGTNSPAMRQDNTELLTYVNEGLKEVATLRPDLFTQVGDMTCVAGQAEQAITFQDAARLLDVLSIHNGAAITPMDRAALDLFKPGWRSDTAGVAEHWAPVEADPLRFFIYPKAPANQVLDVKFVRIPATYALGDTINDLPATFEPALADFVIYRAESKDDEHVISQRAAAHYAAFKAKLGV